jgi:LuxR family transcriptional regulator of csgAB operon
VTTASLHPDVTGITLFSLNNSLQTGLLASLISEKMNISCSVIRHLDADTQATQLLLIDCQALSLDDLRTLVSDIHSHEQPLNAALLNAQYDTEHENLLDWPCISGLFFTDTDQEQLIRGLECLLKGELWVPRRLLHHFLEKNRKAPSNQNSDIKLTKRERQILKLIKKGATNLDIAEHLELSEHTIKSHLYNIYKKIGVRNRLEASNWVRNMDNI